MKSNLSGRVGATNELPEKLYLKIEKIVTAYCYEQGIKDKGIIARRTAKMAKAVQSGIQEIILEDENVIERFQD